MEPIIYLQIVSLCITLVLLGYILYNRIKEEITTRHGRKAEENSKLETPEIPVLPEKPTEASHVQLDMIPLEALRRVGYHGLCEQEDLEHAIFFINDNAIDAIGIFVKVFPEILDILMRTSYIMEEIDREITENDVREREIEERLMAINMALESLTMVTSSLGHKIYDICSKQDGGKEQTEANAEVVRGFIEMSTEMLNYVFEYLDTNNLVYQKIKQKRLSFKESFSEMSSGFLRVFFYGIMNCITMVESTITVLK